MGYCKTFKLFDHLLTYLLTLASPRGAFAPKKTKCMIFNFTDKYQFTTRLRINNEPIEVIDSTKLLGTIITNDLSWDQNISSIVKKANARMQLLRRVAGFGTPIDDLKIIYILFIRSILEQSATLWHSSLTNENVNDLERIQKSAIQIILRDDDACKGIE